MSMTDARDWAEILEKVESGNEEVRHRNIERLVEFPAEKTLPVLLGRLGDSSWRLRKRAVELLVALSDQPNVIEQLVESLSDEENPGRRNAAVEALVQCSEQALAQLLRITHSEDRDVRKFAVDILARIGGETMLSRLVVLLEDVDPNVQGAAADALGMIGFPSAIPDLVRVAGDDGVNHLVRFSAPVLDEVAARVRPSSRRQGVTEVKFDPPKDDGDESATDGEATDDGTVEDDPSAEGEPEAEPVTEPSS